MALERCQCPVYEKEKVFEELYFEMNSSEINLSPSSSNRYMKFLNMIVVLDSERERESAYLLKSI